MIKRTTNTFYGYYILIAAWVVYFFSTTIQAYGLSVVSTRQVLNSGWDESVVGLSMSVCYIAMSTISMPAGMMEHKIGFRRSMMIGSLIGFVTYGLLFLFCGNRLLYVALFFGIGTNSAICGMTSASGLINAWFERKKALPMSLLLTAGSIGGFTMPVIAQFLTDISVRFSFGIYALLCLAAALISFLFIRDKPEDIGEVKDGNAWTLAHPLSGEEMARNAIEDLHAPTLKDCYRSPRLYAIAFLIFVCRSSNSAVTSYILLYAIESGVPIFQATLLLTFYSFASFFGRLSGSLVNHVPWGKRAHNVICYSILAAGTVLLSRAGSYPFFALSMLVMGLGFGMTYSLTFLIPADCFGHHNFTVLNGLFSSLGIAGGIFIPPMIYAIARKAGTYSVSYTVMAVIFAVSTVIAALTPVTRIKRNPK